MSADRQERMKILPVLALLLLLAITMSAQAQTVDTDVLIVGAGVAGIKAAVDLLAANKGISVTVLEARNRPLGRVDTRTDAAWPIPIEVRSQNSTHCIARGAVTDLFAPAALLCLQLGAQWFHGGTSDNAVLAYAKNTSVFNPVIPTVVTPDDEGVIFNGGTVVEDKVEASWQDLYDDFEGTFMPQYRKSKGSAAALTLPLSDCLTAFVRDRGLIGLTAKGFQSMIESNIVQEYAANPERLNLQLWDVSGL